MNFCSSQKASRALLDLAFDGALGCQKDILGDLLGDRAASLDHPAGTQVDHECAQHAEDIHAAMIEEAAVLGRDDSRDKAGGKAFERNDLSAKVTVGRKNPVG